MKTPPRGSRRPVIKINWLAERGWLIACQHSKHEQDNEQGCGHNYGHADECCNSAFKHEPSQHHKQPDRTEKEVKHLH